MAHFHNNALIGASGQGGYNITDSLRFRSSASAYLSRTPTSASNRKTWTLSMWFKLGVLPTTDNRLYYSLSDAGANQVWIYFNSSNGNSITTGIRISSTNYQITLSSVQRDPSAWYHLVYAVDTTQATSSNRVKIYFNGSQVTSFQASSYPPQNADTSTNNTGAHAFGSTSGGGNYFDGYMTEINFVDGQQLTASSFGESNEDTGVWQPIKYTGSYGTNGFYLNFSDGTSTTTLGYDYSGNNNNWTTNNISLTAGTTYDLMSDTPSLADEDTGNFATLNGTFPLSTGLLSEANLKITNGSASWKHAVSSIALPNTGKWYFEIQANVDANNGTMGLAPVEGLANGSNAYITDAILTNTPNSGGTAGGGLAGSTVTWTGTYNISAGDTIACAVDMDANKVWFRIGANWVNAGSGAGDPSAGTNPAVSGGINSSKTYHFVTSVYTQNHTVNFGQRPFAYTPPTGFKKLNTYNLPDSNIKDGSQHFNTVTYTGNGSTQTISGVGFSPDFLWGKSRTTNYYHNLTDTVRGLTKYLYSSQTNSEFTTSDKVTSVTSDGFTLGADTSTNGSVNISGQSQVMWCWRGSDSAAVTNTNGTRTSTVSVNATAGFSIVKFNSGSSTFTVGHGLGTTPAMLIMKDISTSTNWAIWHKSLPNTAQNWLQFDTGSTYSSATAFNNTAPTASVVSLSNSYLFNSNSDCIMYAFAEVEGFSKFGKYTGNGSADGTFVYTGFRPAFVMVKRTDTSGAPWYMWDSRRNTYNITNLHLYANQDNADVTESNIDLLSNGFKWRNSISDGNANGGTFFYMTFAENPFKNALAR